jgi:hypothetical protein
MVNEVATPLETPPDAGRESVFSSLRQVDQPPLATGFALHCRFGTEGLSFLRFVALWLGSWYVPQMLRQCGMEI